MCVFSNHLHIYLVTEFVDSACKKCDAQPRTRTFEANNVLFGCALTDANSSGLGFILVREVRNSFRKTLGAEQALEIQDALVYAGKFAQRQHWTSAEDKKRWAVVRDAAEAAIAVIRQSDAVVQANGRISSVDVTSDL